MILINAERYSVTGNTFFLIDLSEFLLVPIQRIEITRLLCQSFTQFKTDGMVFIEPVESGSSFYRWDFYNGDGSLARMCGNAARMVTHYLCHKFGSETAHFLTQLGEIKGQLLENKEVRVQWPNVIFRKPFFKSVDGIKGLWVDSGVPHFVIIGKQNKELSSNLRRSADFGVEGANITFVEKSDFHESNQNYINAITFERGVEDFTLSCGTGAVAAAIWFSEMENCETGNKSQVNDVHVKMPGGLLKVSKNRDQSFFEGNFYLQGEVKKDFKIIWEGEL